MTLGLGDQKNENFQPVSLDEEDYKYLL